MAMRNTLLALNDILFEQIERINDDELHGDELEEQIKKSRMVVNTSEVIVKNAEVILNATKFNLKAKDECLVESSVDAVPKIMLSAN